jgi:surface protein
MSIQSLTLRFTTGTPPTTTTQEIPVSTINLSGSNSVAISQSLIDAVNAQPAGTSFTPSIAASYGNDESGNAITSVTSPASNAPSFIPRVISLASVINKTANNAPFNLSGLVTTISAGVLSYLSSNPSVASVDSSGQVTLLAEGVTTITINVTATADHLAGSASTTLNVTPPPPPIILATNGVTIQYTGTAQAVIDAYNSPTPSPLFILANPRGTLQSGVPQPEWFAVVNDSSWAALANYIRSIPYAVSYFTKSGQPSPVPFNNIVTTRMTFMRDLFNNVFTFNYNITSWDTSSAVYMDNMFANARAFNQDIGVWDVSNVVDGMGGMFTGALAFNKDISGWDVSNVTNMAGMFYNANAFNNGGSSEIGNWDTSSVTNMSNMFTNAIAFNRDIYGWVVSAVTNMSGMFSGANAFNNGGSSEIGNWDTSSVTNMSAMFTNAIAFNRDISGWVVSEVKNMSGMFSGASNFNQPIGEWVTSKVTNMNSMFTNAIAFNNGGTPNIFFLNTSSVVFMNYMFNGATIFNQNISAWNVGLVTPKPPIGFRTGSALITSNMPPAFR